MNSSTILSFADAVVQSDSQLAAKRLVSPEGRGDGNRAATIALSVSRLEGAIAFLQINAVKGFTRTEGV